jgi:hypothetical protein
MNSSTNAKQKYRGLCSTLHNSLLSYGISCMALQLHSILYEPNIAIALSWRWWRKVLASPQAHHRPHQAWPLCVLLSCTHTPVLTSYPPPEFSSALPRPKVFIYCSHQVTLTHLHSWMASHSAVIGVEVLVLRFLSPSVSAHMLLSFMNVSAV